MGRKWREVWDKTSNGKFPTSSAYYALYGFENVGTSSVWAQMWNFRGPLRQSLLLWFIVNGRTLTRHFSFNWGVVPNDFFPFHQSEPKTILHLLRDCAWVKQVWNMLVQPNFWGRFHSHTKYDLWIRDNIRSLWRSDTQQREWKYVLGIL